MVVMWVCDLVLDGSSGGTVLICGVICAVVVVLCGNFVFVVVCSDCGGWRLIVVVGGVGGGYGHRGGCWVSCGCCYRLDGGRLVLMHFMFIIFFDVLYAKI